ncbi:hypothetical protein AAG906_016746 [Vitis piasezkii]
MLVSIDLPLFAVLSWGPEHLARDLSDWHTLSFCRIVDRDQPEFSSLDSDRRYHGITLGCYIGIGSEDKWVPGPAIAGSGEHPA